ncbi:ABC transporter permease [Camelimonas fluminis]|uniref:ABC transporter permease n=1 Tax=Camelimonas fluminis TaxID=1576911 RepID=A0ABV7UD34_9HYPH|nr:ABC transporter permease subunit [Camelimonas fluminis]GHE47109.1 ABC transporter permease [Camelimonas fluminis]
MITQPFLGRRWFPNVWDIVAFALLVAIMVSIAMGARDAAAPLEALRSPPVTTDPAHLPYYALRTTLRMLAAMAASLAFTMAFGALCIRSRKLAMVLEPAVDILQSVPVLGFLTFTITFFLGLFPGQIIGAEFAAVFAIFTSQAWNMALSFLQSARNTPRDLEEAAASLQLSAWQKFWRLTVPFAMPGLVWNMMMSMSGGWFFIVASEALTVGDQHIILPGVGSYLARAVDEGNLHAVGYATLTMIVVILIYDQVLFRPLTAWADKFRMTGDGGDAAEAPGAWLLDFFRRTRVLRAIVAPAGGLLRQLGQLRLDGGPGRRRRIMPQLPPGIARMLDLLWMVVVVVGALWASWLIISFIRVTLAPADFVEAIRLGCFTFLRVMAVVILASIFWTPIGVWIGMRPWVAVRAQPIVQFAAAFPANLLFPVVVAGIVAFHGNPNIWLTVLMALGAQWYILFNVIAGASAIPGDLREAGRSLSLRGALRWRTLILPGILPYYVTGALTAAGGAWNASIVAEIAQWGSVKLVAAGLGSYIAQASEAGDLPRVVLGVTVMSLFVLALNRVLWLPLRGWIERRFRL